MRPMSLAVDVTEASIIPIQLLCSAINTAVERLYLTRAVFTHWPGLSPADKVTSMSMEI